VAARIPVEEDWLVLRAQTGDARAFDALLRRYEAPLYRHICRLQGDPEAAYEILQETYLNIVRCIGDLERRESFRPWAYGVATRSCLRWLRQRRRRPQGNEPSDEMVDPEPLPEALVGQLEVASELGQSVAVLSHPLRSVVLLHYFEGLTLGEVAAALEITLGTVKSRLNAALRQLRTRTRGATP
jgi:RNA polymerase sigma-70 factor (ECF subfamily)